MTKQILVFIGILITLVCIGLLFLVVGWWALLPLVIGAVWGAVDAYSKHPEARDPNQSPLDVYLSKQRKS